MDAEEKAAERQRQIATELRAVEYEINGLTRRRADYLESIERHQRPGGSPHEIERLTELVGKVDANLQINKQRRDYLERALKDVSLELSVEHKYSLALKPKSLSPKYR